MKKRKRESTKSPTSRGAAASDDASYDSYEEPAQVQEHLSSWRQDPEESLSDWTFEIVHVNRERIHATYRVHKLLSPSVRAEVNAFLGYSVKGGQFSETTNATSHIELEELAANPFQYRYFWITRRARSPSLD